MRTALFLLTCLVVFISYLVLGTASQANTPPKTANALSTTGVVSAAALAADDRSPTANSVNLQNLELVPNALADYLNRLNLQQMRLMAVFAGHYINLRTPNVIPVDPQDPTASINAFIALINGTADTKNLVDMTLPGSTINIMDEIQQLKLPKRYNKLKSFFFVQGLSTALQNNPLYKDDHSLKMVKPIVNEGLQVILDTLPVNIVAEIFAAGTNVRLGGSAVGALQGIYSNGLYGFDIAAQTYFTQPHGNGFTFRLNLSPERSACAQTIRDYAAPLEIGKEDLSRITTIPENKQQKIVSAFAYIIRGDANKKLEMAKNAAVSISMSFRIVALVSYDEFSDNTSLFNFGLSVSQLFPVYKNKRGVGFLFNIEERRLSSSTNPNPPVGAAGLAIYWQDQIFRIKDNGAADLVRWRTQVGVEYDLEDHSLFKDTYGVFWRRRLAKFTEVTFLSGISYNVPYFGLNFSRTFGL